MHLYFQIVAVNGEFYSVQPHPACVIPCIIEYLYLIRYVFKEQNRNQIKVSKANRIQSAI